tara:strand:+ start:373 stop:486 length:114 start_codon:yes stop_codon:yes gene_type:complete
MGPRHGVPAPGATGTRFIHKIRRRIRYFRAAIDVAQS